MGLNETRKLSGSKRNGKSIGLSSNDRLSIELLAVHGCGSELMDLATHAPK